MCSSNCVVTLASSNLFISSAGGSRPPCAANAAQGQVSEAVRDGVKRLLRPAVERDMRAELSEAAAKHALNSFSLNLRNL